MKQKQSRKVQALAEHKLMRGDLISLALVEQRRDRCCRLHALR